MQPHQTLLITELAKRRKKNLQFSLRAFARILDVSPSQLSALMNGRKNLTRNLAAKIADRLALTPLETKHILQSTLHFAEDQSVEAVNEMILKEDEFELISRWHYFAILSLGRLPKNSATGKWIGERLGISSIEALEALARLKRLKLIEVKNGQFSQTTEPLSTTTDIPSSAIRNYHKENLELAKQKIDTVTLDKRNYSTITMAVNPRKIKKVKKMMDEFKKQVCKELEQEPFSEVYTLAMQLFPVTQGENNEK